MATDYISRLSQDMTGKVFGDLTVVGFGEKHRYPSGIIANWWECECVCGKRKIVDGRNLRSGRVKNCGCKKTAMLNALNYKHGGAGRKNEERLYTIWRGMKQRCENEHNRSYKYYGKRGIGVCDEWSDFSAFREWALNNGYDENAKYGDCTIDRIDNDRGYEPSNCRWVSLAEQNRNKRRKAE